MRVFNMQLLGSKTLASLEGHYKCENKLSYSITVT